MERYSRAHLRCRRATDGTLRLMPAPRLRVLLGEPWQAELPGPGARVQRGARFAIITGARAQTDLPAPVSGTVLASGDAAGDWWVTVQPDAAGDWNDLWSAKAYESACA